jgi:hypothetical protein
LPIAKAFRNHRHEVLRLARLSRMRYCLELTLDENIAFTYERDTARIRRSIDR